MNLQFRLDPSISMDFDFVIPFHDKYMGPEWNKAKKYAKSCDLMITKKGLELLDALSEFAKRGVLETLSPVVMIDDEGFEVPAMARFASEFGGGQPLTQIEVFGFILTQKGNHISFGQRIDDLLKDGNWIIEMKGGVRVLIKVPHQVRQPFIKQILKVKESSNLSHEQKTEILKFIAQYPFQEMVFEGLGNSQIMKVDYAQQEVTLRDFVEYSVEEVLQLDFVDQEINQLWQKMKQSYYEFQSKQPNK